MSVPVPTQPGDLPGGDLQGGEQRGGAIADIVMGALLGMPGLHRQRLLGPVQRLDLGLLVHTQHDRVLRRSQIQPDDVGDLGDQLRAYEVPREDDDMDPEGERQISAYVKETYGHEFVFLTDYASSIRPFYHMRHADDASLTNS